MQGLDGFGYKLAGGVTGSFTMDAVVSLAACALLLWPVLRWIATGKLEVTSEKTGPDEDSALRAVTLPS
jgi:PAT family beta-lactamase induction signal transducer AmpG